MLRVGERINHFRLISPLGEGGQGVVWRVEDLLSPGITRALKLVDVNRKRPDEVERVRREAALLQGLSHPSLVPIREMFEDFDAGVVGLVLELVEGRPLESLLDGERLTTAHREILLEHVLGVLAHVHDRGIAHRDLTPRNLLVTERFWREPRAPDAVKLVDFGIAVSGEGPSGLTAAGAFIGSLPFVPPERLDPRFWRSAAAPMAGDVFSFGVLGWLLISRRHPAEVGWGGSETDYALAYRDAARSPAPWPAGRLEGRWGPVLARCLALHVDARPRSAQEVQRLVVAAAGAAEGHASTATVPHALPSVPSGAAGSEPTAGPTLAAPVEPRIETGGGATLSHPGLPAPRPATAPLRRGALALVALAGLGALALGAGPLLAGAYRAVTRTGGAAPSDAAARPALAAPYASPACPAPCCGGSACAARRESCNLPGLACVPGRCGPMEGGESFDLLVSHVKERTREGSYVTGCSGSARAARVCFKKHASPDWTCADVASLCAGHFPRVLEVTVDDLTRTGVDLEILDRGGARLGHRDAARYRDGVARSGLCTGFVFGGFEADGAEIVEVGYFLQPR